MDSEKIGLAKQLYIRDGKTLMDICLLLDISMLVLREKAEKDKWAAQRQSELSRREGEDVLAEHARISESQLRWIKVLMIRQADAELTFDERKALTYDIARALELAEAFRHAVETDRLIHGIAKGKPSVAKDDGEVDGVTYVVSKPIPAELPETQQV